MSDEMRELFDRWERVWHEGRHELFPSCIAPHYIRHDEKGDRTVTPESYAAELAAIRQERPDIRVEVYDHSFASNRAWYRFSFRMGKAMVEIPPASFLQAETWVTLLPLGTAWTDAVAQESWTSPPPI